MLLLARLSGSFSLPSDLFCVSVVSCLASGVCLRCVRVCCFFMVDVVCVLSVCDLCCRVVSSFLLCFLCYMALMLRLLFVVACSVFLFFFF